MAISNGDIIKATARLAWDGLSDIMNTWAVEILDIGLASASQRIDAVLEFIDDIYSAFAGSVPNNTDFVDINLYNITQDEPMGSFDWPTLNTGAGIGDPYAPGVAVFCWLPTAVSESFGRKWIGPFQESNFAAGVAIGPLVALVANGLDLCLVPFTSGGVVVDMRYVVEHKFEDGLELFPPQYNVPVGHNIASNAGYQRRRRPGIGS